MRKSIEIADNNNTTEMLRRMGTNNQQCGPQRQRNNQSVYHRSSNTVGSTILFWLAIILIFGEFETGEYRNCIFTLVFQISFYSMRDFWFIASLWIMKMWFWRFFLGFGTEKVSNKNEWMNEDEVVMQSPQYSTLWTSHSRQNEI